jgi:disulfide bond formation protein DsbB
MSWIALVRRDRRLGPYWIGLSLAGIAVSIYHYLLEWFPEITSSVCSMDVPCTTVWFREFGFVTLAFMAGSAFVFVIAMSLVMMINPSDGEE